MDLVDNYIDYENLSPMKINSVWVKSLNFEIFNKKYRKSSIKLNQI